MTNAYFQSFTAAPRSRGAASLISALFMVLIGARFANAELKNPAASCEESSIPMEKKHTYSRSLTPKQASREKANDTITKREAQLPYLGERSDNPLAVGFTGQEAVWKQGIRLIESNKVFEGIRLLDSLRMSGYHDARFLSDYARSVFMCFIPPKTDSGMPDLREVLQHFSFDTTTPASLSWNVSKSEQGAYPSFQYKATFVCRKPFTLVFQEFEKIKRPLALLRYHELQPQTYVQRAFAEQFIERQDSANFTVCFDLNDTKSPLMEYVGRRINGVYDSINSQNDLRKYRALSLRCFRRSFYSGIDDRYAAFVVFDRTLADLQNIPPHKRRPAGPEANRKIRFTVAIRSGLDVKAFSEEKLQTILRAF